ncbi:hypothetical protein QBC37DRAFT_400584 [Rhypophila decipiens]|uniref:F-box domain-containing protein n=1 Tax=Rhypophila decipiens TaxID=261697 RepID=A0AAN6Y669_9PEZI|nr:hypothetical protein QBC37DRAFT_400584 [Rhypophila decipiens]
MARTTAELGIFELRESDQCMQLFKQLMLHHENEKLAIIQRGLQHNPKWFDPNPWENLPPVNLERMLRGEDSESQTPLQGNRGRRANIDSLPTELLKEIGDYLPLMSKASFALTSRRLYHEFAPIYLAPLSGLSAMKRFEFLQLLERDSSCLVACPGCRKLHHWSSAGCRDGTDDNANNSPARPYSPRLHLRLPPFLGYALIRTIGRLYVKYGDKSRQCTQLLDLARTQSQSLWEPSVRATRSISIRFINDHLISRSQIAIAPCLNGVFTGTSFLTLIKAFTTPQFQICDHLDFPTFLRYMDLLKAQDNYGENDKYPSIFSTSITETWGKKGAHCEDKYSFYKIWGGADRLGIIKLGAGEMDSQAQNETLSRALRGMLFWGFPGQVRSCSFCATDFGLGVQTVPGAGPTLVMSVWRNLGGPCKVGDDALRSAGRWKWDSHRNVGIEKPLGGDWVLKMAELKTAGTTTRGAIYKGFESVARGVDPETLKPTDFVPHLDPEDTETLWHGNSASNSPK